MNAIEKKVGELVSSKQTGLMTHIVVGNPSLEASKQLVRTMAQAGADFIELQIPFSDPIADGGTMMKANQVSLDNGTTVADCFQAMRELSAEVDTPLLFMGYYNIVYQYGVDDFCRDAAAAGASGLLFPDMPLDEEEGEQFFSAAEKYDLLAIRFISPASTDERIEKNVNGARGFLYCFSRYGVTGAQSEVDPRLPEYLSQVKILTDLPLAVGFGISQRSHVEGIAKQAQIAVVGSAMLNRYEELPAGKKMEGIAQYVKELKGVA